MSEFRRTVTRGDRLARQRRAAEAIRREPRATVECVATEDRTAGKNTVIFRTHRKRLGAALRVSAADAKRIIVETADIRRRVKNGEAEAVALLREISARLQALLKKKVLSERLYRTGQLHRSITGKARP